MVVRAGYGPLPPSPRREHHRLSWRGEVPAPKWVSFYTRVLTKLVQSGDVRLTVGVEARSPDGLSAQKIEETKLALRELGLDDAVLVE